MRPLWFAPCFKKRTRISHDQQRHVHQQIFAGEGELDYAFMGKNPSAADNVWFREAAERQILVVYFLGVCPGRDQATIPTFRRGVGPASRGIDPRQPLSRFKMITDHPGAVLILADHSPTACRWSTWKDQKQPQDSPSNIHRNLCD